MIQLPRRLAHRGASAIAPENTLAALEKAYDLGASWVECDVQLTKDLVPVVIHDWRLNRTTNGQGYVCNSTWQYVQTLDAGSFFAPCFSSQRVVDLETWLLVALKLGIHLNIELKERTRERAYLLARQVAVTLARLGVERVGIDVLLSSSHRPCLAACKEYMPHYPRAIIANAWSKKIKALAVQLHSASVHLNHAMISQADIDGIHKAGLAVLVWTVNNERRINALYEMGVDGVFSDVVSDA